MLLEFLDQRPLWAVFACIVCILFGGAEIGFYLGKWRKGRSQVEEEGLNAILGAATGLLAFMLAFSFGMAGSQNGVRKAAVLEEANAIGTAYLRAQLLPEPHSSEIQDLLREYVDVRIEATRLRDMDMVKDGLTRSEELHEKLWARSIALSREDSRSLRAVFFFSDSLNDVIDLHSKRVTAALYNRIPRGIYHALVFVAVMTMTLMGYRSGLTGVRTLIPRFALILAFGAVMLLVTELDRPNRTGMKINQQVVIDLQEKMSKAKQ
jgi:hypothetical protein